MFENDSLFDTVVNYCHNQYILNDCNRCDYNGCCPGNPCGNCKQCLEEVHYPSRYPSGRKDYECDRMLYFYVCDYAEKYGSEMLYLMRKSKALEEIEKYHVLSIGCGSCPDLMALERYCSEEAYTKSISYVGIDVNERWNIIHKRIENYNSNIIKKVQFRYYDAVDDDYTISNTNVVVLQYVISHLYNNGQIEQVNDFFRKLIDDIIVRKQEEVPMVILINDVNSIYRGRDYFEDLVDQLRDSDFSGNCNRYYFDYNIQNDAQRYGEKHKTVNTIFSLPNEFESIYQPWHYCSSAQLLIEVW